MTRRSLLQSATAAGFQKVAVPIIELPDDTGRRAEVDRKPGHFLENVHTALLRDNGTIAAVYSPGDASPRCALQLSRDGGLTWQQRLAPDDPATPPGGAPAIHRVTNGNGMERLLLFVAGQRLRLSVSGDGGLTWSPFLDAADSSPAVGPPRSLVVLRDGRLLGVYCEVESRAHPPAARYCQILSDDGGATWSRPRSIGAEIRRQGFAHAAPALVRSPDGKGILLLGAAHFMISNDDGESWQEPRPLPSVLLGAGHAARYAPDGRLVVCFQDHTGQASQTYGHIVGWVGRYEDIVEGKQGEYRLFLQRHYGAPDGAGCCGLEALRGGVFAAICSAARSPGEANSIISIRFSMGDAGALARRGSAAEVGLKPRREVRSPRTGTPAETVVWTRGENGVHTYRIPVLLTSNKGTLIAVCDARVERPQDAPNNIDLVLKRSFDGGRTWSRSRVLLDEGPESAANACGLVDRQTSAIWIFYLRAPVWKGDPADRAAALEARDRVMSTWAIRSDDDGETWSAPVDLTSQLKKPDWYGVAIGPGIGIQTRTGRLVLPCYRGPRNQWTAYAAFSDDHGRTWRVGGEADLDTNECQAAELADGALMLNMRSYRGKGCRAVQTSADGGLTWSTVVDDRTLVDPVCQASLLRHPASGRSRLLFANAADTLHRRRMTVRLSYDEGRTWPYAKTIHYGPAAYSSLTALKDGSVGLLYEKDDYRSLAFARFTLEWLTDGKDRI